MRNVFTYENPKKADTLINNMHVTVAEITVLLENFSLRVRNKAKFVMIIKIIMVNGVEGGREKNIKKTAHHKSIGRKRYCNFMLRPL